MKTASTRRTLEGLWADWMAAVPDNLKEADGIKAQLAAAAAVILFIQDQNPGSPFDFQPTEVGSEDDRRGIDGYFVERATNTYYAVDFSLEHPNNPKGNKANSEILVHLRREWFNVRPDGIWELRPECLRSLIQSFKEALRNGPVNPPRRRGH
jgi:hypothetical protein